MKLDQNDLLRVYDMVVREEHFFIDAHQARVAFYAKFVGTLVAVTILGVFKASEWYHFAALSAGPVIIYAVSSIARDACFRLYQRFLETVSTRAKIEQDLDLTQPRPEAEADPNDYWAAEPIVAPRHVTSRKRYRSSEEFIKSNMGRGFHLWTDRVFRGFEVLSGVAFVGLMFLAILRAAESFGNP